MPVKDVVSYVKDDDITLRFLLPCIDSNCLSTSTLLDYGDRFHVGITRKHYPKVPDQILTISGIESSEVTDAYETIHRALVNNSRDFKLIVRNVIRVLLHEYHVNKLSPVFQELQDKYTVKITAAIIPLSRSTEFVLELEGILCNVMLLLGRLCSIMKSKPVPKTAKSIAYNVLHHSEGKAYDSLSYKFDDLVPIGRTPTVNSSFLNPPAAPVVANTTQIFSSLQTPRQFINTVPLGIHSAKRAAWITGRPTMEIIREQPSKDSDAMSVSSTIIGSVIQPNNTNGSTITPRPGFSSISTAATALNNQAGNTVSISKQELTSLLENSRRGETQIKEQQAQIQRLTTLTQKQSTENYCLKQQLESHQDQQQMGRFNDREQAETLAKHNRELMNKVNQLQVEKTREVQRLNAKITDQEAQLKFMRQKYESLSLENNLMKENATKNPLNSTLNSSGIFSSQNSSRPPVPGHSQNPNNQLMQNFVERTGTMTPVDFKTQPAKMMLDEESNQMGIDQQLSHDLNPCDTNDSMGVDGNNNITAPANIFQPSQLVSNNPIVPRLILQNPTQGSQTRAPSRMQELNNRMQRVDLTIKKSRSGSQLFGYGSNEVTKRQYDDFQNGDTDSQTDSSDTDSSTTISDSDSDDPYYDYYHDGHEDFDDFDLEEAFG